MAMDALVRMLVRDWNGIIWKEGCNDPTTAMIGAYDKSNQLPKDDGIGLSAVYNAINLTLRLDNLLGACATVMGGFHSLPTMMNVSHNYNGGVGNAKLHIMISTVGILPDGYQQTNPLPRIPTKQSVPTSREVLPG
jgi:hypothetical protein